MPSNDIDAKTDRWGPQSSEAHHAERVRGTSGMAAPSPVVAVIDAIHRLIAYVAIPLIAAGIGWSVVLAVTDRPGGVAFERFQAGVVSLLIVGIASGVILLATGTRPADGLHLLYAGIAVVMVPLARSFTGRSRARGSAVLLLVAFVALGAVLYRLFTTG